MLTESTYPASTWQQLSGYASQNLASLSSLCKEGHWEFNCNVTENEGY